jgi:hypothetical protein
MWDGGQTTSNGIETKHPAIWSIVNVDALTRVCRRYVVYQEDVSDSLQATALNHDRSKPHRDEPSNESLSAYSRHPLKE